MPIPKTAIEYFKSERAKHTKPYQKFYDEALAALEKVNSFQNVNSCGVEGGTFQNGNDHLKKEYIEREALLEKVKCLKWLVFQFPLVDNPKDDADKICNCIHSYCENAINAIETAPAVYVEEVNHGKENDNA